MEFMQNQAIYLQIAEYIMENILTKTWKEQDRIPSVRDLAVSTQVNPNTVMRAYTYLQDKGILTNQRGIGYFIGTGAYQNTLNLKKEGFIRDEMPRFFRSLELLGLSMQDVNRYYTGFSKQAGSN